METSSRKKLGKLGILTKENAPDWFRIMESHLRGEKLWKVIQEVIRKQASNRPRAAAAESVAMSSSAPSPEAVATPGTLKSSDESIKDQLRTLAANKE